MKIFKFLSFIIVTHILVFLVSKVDLTFISVGMVFPTILLIVLILNKIDKRLAAIAMLLIVAHNILKVTTKTDSIFKVQPGMNLQSQLRVVKKTYELANGKDFSINTVTNPYMMPTLWEYLYLISSASNNLKKPYYKGITAYSFAGDYVLPKNDSRREIEFLISEPEVGAADSWTNQLLDQEKRKKTLSDTIKLDGFTLYVFKP